MSNDLVKRLREDFGFSLDVTAMEAADRIEALEAEVKRLEQQLKMARRLAHRSQPEYPPEIGIPHLRED
jgi:BMFP domain-containing protein YqiC